MPMKTILFHINYFLAGGIEKVLIELLKSLDPDKYRIKLSIGYNLEELEILKPQIPDYVEIYYLLNTLALTQRKKKKLKKEVGVAGKIVEELILPTFKKRLMSNRLKGIIGNVNVIVDYDMTQADFHNVMQAKKKVA